MRPWAFWRSGPERAARLHDRARLEHHVVVVLGPDDLALHGQMVAGADLIEHALVVPYGVSVSDYVATKLNMYEAQYAPFGVSVLRYKGQHLYDRFLSLEDLAAFKAEYEKNAK